MTPDVIAAATNMINNLNPMAVLQVSSDDNGDGDHDDDGDDGDHYGDAERYYDKYFFLPDDWDDSWGRRDAKYGSC